MILKSSVTQGTEYKLLIQSYIIKPLNPYASVGVQGNTCFAPISLVLVVIF